MSIKSPGVHFLTLELYTIISYVLGIVPIGVSSEISYTFNVYTESYTDIAKFYIKFP